MQTQKLLKAFQSNVSPHILKQLYQKNPIPLKNIPLTDLIDTLKKDQSGWATIIHKYCNDDDKHYLEKMSFKHGLAELPLLGSRLICAYGFVGIFLTEMWEYGPYVVFGFGSVGMIISDKLMKDSLVLKTQIQEIEIVKNTELIEKE